MSIVKSFAVGNGDMFSIHHNSDNFTIIDRNIIAETAVEPIDGPCGRFNVRCQLLWVEQPERSVLLPQLRRLSGPRRPRRPVE